MFGQTLNFNQSTLNNGMPNMANTLNNWQVPLSLVKVTQSVVEGELVTTEEKIDFLGVWQPLSQDRLNAKEDGQRSWEWIWLHAKAGTLNLTTSDKVRFNNKRYKVMALKDYSLNGYIEYEMIRDYE